MSNEAKEELEKIIKDYLKDNLRFTLYAESTNSPCNEICLDATLSLKDEIICSWQENIYL